MRRVLKWLFMLNKRLYKKISFLVILAIIPICVFSFTFVAQQDNGFLHIVLAQTENDEISTQVIDELMNENSIVNFTKATSPDAAMEAVKMGQADEAWIFPENMQDKINDFITSKEQGVVTIVSREQTVFLRIAHEKLTAALYKHCAKAYYINYAKTSDPKLDSLSDEELIEYFENASISEELFVYGNPSIDASTQSTDETDYLTTPIRGLLGVLIVICGMAAALYCMQDEKSGTFSWVPETSRIYIAFSCLIIAVVNVAAVVMISLFAAGLATNFLRELLSILLYVVCCAVFCLLLKQIFGSIKLYSAIIPLFAIVMIAVCPVFFDFRVFLGVQLIFPPTYYVNAIYDSKYLLYMMIYSLVGGVLCLALNKCREIKIWKHN